MPRINRVLETVLYVDDLDRACVFYEQVLGLACIHTDARHSRPILFRLPLLGRVVASGRHERIVGGVGRRHAHQGAANRRRSADERAHP